LCAAATAAALCSAGPSARADYPSQVLAFQPLTYWRFSETGPFSFTATNLGTLGAAANGVYSDPTAMEGQPGALVGSSDTAAAFNGSYEKIDVPFNAALNPASFSFECWAKVEGGEGNYRSPVTSRDATSAITAGYIFYAGAGDTWEFWTGSGTGWNTLTTAATNGPVVIGAWTHLVGTYDATSLTMSFYINGTLAMQETNITVAPVGSVGSPCPLRVGAGGTEGPGEYWFNGIVDEVAVYPSVLTEAQVAAHFAVAMTNGPAYASQVLALQPALYLRLDDTSANPPALNLGSLGAAANGIYNSGVQPSPDDLVSPAFPGFGATNTGLVFDGNGDSLDIGYTNIPTPWTAVFWVNAQTPPGAPAVLMWSPATALNLDDTNMMVGFTVFGVTNYVFNYAAPTNDTWVNLAFVATDTYTLLYANGSLQDSNPASITLPMTSIGNPTTNFMSATVDEVATFGTALLDGQIKTLYLTAVGDQHPPSFVQDVPIISPPGTIYATTPFAINADVYGAGLLTYQWYRNGTLVGTNAAYAEASASLANSGNYDVIVTNANGSVTSAVVTLTVEPALPPSIKQPPAARPVYPGGTAFFTVAASGTPPLSFQWKENGTNIAGATDATLTITNAGPTNAANYSVGVTNVVGGTVSAGAALTLITPATGTYEAAVLASGPMAYWRLNEKSGAIAYDYQGANDGVYTTNVTLGQPGYSPLDTDTSAGFETNPPSAVIVTNSAPFNFSGSTPTFSCEIWANFNDMSGVERLFSNRAPGWGFGISTASGLLFTTFTVQDFSQALQTPLQLNTWYHIVGVSDGGSFYFYVNGEPVGAIAFSGALLPSSAPLYLGGNPNQTGGAQAVSGDLAEAAIYDRALTAAEISGHFNVGLFGTNTAPFIVQQPASQTVAVGSNPTLSVTAEGSPPFSYQWSNAGGPITGATNSSLTLSNVPYTAAGAFSGAFSVAIANAVGRTNSAPATLTVLPVPTFANLTNALVLHLSFNGNTLDSSGRTNNATIMGSCPFVPGELGQAIELSTDADTNYNYLAVSDLDGDLSFTATNSFSVSLWLKFTTGFNDLPIIGNAVNSTYNPGWVLTEDDNEFEWTAVGSDTGSVIADPVGGPLINDGNWHQLAVVFDRSVSNALSYVDGQWISTLSIAALGDLRTGEPLTIGQDPTGGYNVSGTFDLDDLGIWRRALSGYEVLSIYTAAQDSHESFDVYGPVKVSIAPDGAQVILAWQAGTLESADELQGAQTVWTPVTGAAPPVYTLPHASPAHKFYRIAL
jgi:hypothetical protein